MKTKINFRQTLLNNESAVLFSVTEINRYMQGWDALKGKRKKRTGGSTPPETFRQTYSNPPRA